MKVKKGFLLLESVLGLLIAISISSLIFLNIAESKKIQKKQELKSDYYLAAVMLMQDSKKTVTIHNHQFSLLKVGEKNILLEDKTAKETISLAK